MSFSITRNEANMLKHFRVYKRAVLSLDASAIGNAIRDLQIIFLDYLKDRPINDPEETELMLN